MKRRTLLLSALALLLVLGGSIGETIAYFSTYAEAKGGYTIELGDSTEIREEFSNWTKRVSIASDANSEPVFIRVKAFCGSRYTLSYTDATGRWSLGGDGWYYYSEIVEGGAATGELQIHIDNVPSTVTDGDSFNVVVIYESTPVRYREDGSAYADWSSVLDSGSSDEGGAA